MTLEEIINVYSPILYCFTAVSKNSMDDTGIGIHFIWLNHEDVLFSFGKYTEVFLAEILAIST